MSTLKIHLFGPLQIVRAERKPAPFPTRKSQALFAFLALHHRQLHPREVLAATFWPESPASSARKRLRTELWLTRKFLEPETNGESVLTVRNDSVGFNARADAWIDVAEFEEKLKGETKILPHGPIPSEEIGSDEVRRLRGAIELYRGDLLEGNYEDWCLEARETLQALLLSALEKIMTFYLKRREWNKAIDYGQRILRHEPLAENVHRDLMRCHWEMGNRTAALRQYSRCADLLRREFEVEPMHETSILFRQIKTSQTPLTLYDRGEPLLSQGRATPA